MKRGEVTPVSLRYDRCLVIGHLAIDPGSGEKLHPHDSLRDNDHAHLPAGGKAVDILEPSSPPVRWSGWFNPTLAT
jgi:hypothetical protein